MGIRREGRELALKYIYQIDLGVNFEERALAQLDTEKHSKKVKAFAKDRLLGLYNSKDQIDAIARKHLTNWTLERLNQTDRSILRLAVFEMKFDPGVPEKVALNEALELAKRFGSDESSKFLNGVLDAIMHDDSFKIPKNI
ncbi:MAG TPA: transcription antitermination factor NusB [Acidobacteriota bacterium]|nr:transcription antitermination factor NusB [Acidobacteriota bacterium]HNT16667.1 transcription antitermination factor NusB [Acidobacteriota bacterium]HPA26270.1 transcription antitermination factor NusB [Acidobacteriota bacterium]HQO19546.1 transcription antitermination factor NusB [Acidobacteriota bacterium]HQQ46278.1 transcription antitermination factor NusB [Acidobacteriota bacterium]